MVPGSDATARVRRSCDATAARRSADLALAAEPHAAGQRQAGSVRRADAAAKDRFEAHTT